MGGFGDTEGYDGVESVLRSLGKARLFYLRLDLVNFDHISVAIS